MQEWLVLLRKGFLMELPQLNQRAHRQLGQALPLIQTVPLQPPEQVQLIQIVHLLPPEQVQWIQIGPQPLEPAPWPVLQKVLPQKVLLQAHQTILPPQVLMQAHQTILPLQVLVLAHQTNL